jgi:hypothetical protein
MVVDAVAGLALHLGQDGLDSGVLYLCLATADGTDDMVVVDRIADDVRMFAGRQVNSLQQAQLSEQVEGAKDGGAADGEVTPADIV